MNVDFFFSKVVISNFRGISDLTLDLSSDAPTVLIGPNNAGKSTILDAIGLCLSSAKFGKYVPADGDFFTNGSGEIADDFSIEVHLSTKPGGNLPPVKGGIGDPIYVHGIRAVGNRSEPSLTRYLFDDTGANIMLAVSVPVSKARKEEFKGSGLGGRRFARVSDIAKWLPKVFQLDAQNLYTSLYKWESGPLQRLMTVYREHLVQDSWPLDDKRQMPDWLQTIHRFLNDKVLPSPYWNDPLAKELSERLREYLGRSPGFSMRPQLEAIEQWLKSELMFRVSPGTGLASVDSQRLGAGWQSLIRMAALQAIMKIENFNVLLLMEEPETFLHPHLRRRMRRVFNTLQSNGSQCLLTTHSAEFITFSDNQDIVRLQMTAQGVSQHRYQTAAAGQAMKDDEKLQEYGTHELVFARSVVLGEGKDDRFAIRQGLQAIGVDCDAESISVIGASGIGNLPDYARLCSTLGIPWLAVHDLDMLPTGGQKPKTTSVHNELTTIKGQKNSIHVWDNTLEDVLDCPESKANPEWTLTTYGPQNWAQLKSNSRLTKYTTVIEAIKTFCTS